MDISKLSPIGQANYKGVLEGQKVYEGFAETTKQAMEINKALLLKLVADNKDTEYGKKYGFDQIKTIEDYQRQVPLTTYSDYKPYIYRMTEEGEENLLTVYPLIHYSKSSGTTGDCKRIPFTQALADIHSKYGIAYQDGLMAEKMGLEWIDGKKISLLESGITTLKCGLTYGSFSGKTILACRDTLGYLFTSPVEAMIPDEHTDTQYLYARFALMEAEVTGLFCTMYSFAVEFMRYIEHHWEMLVRDIKEGTIDESIEMLPEVRAGLLASITPMPQRAATLEAIFAQGFDEPIAPKLWPRMAYAVGVGTGSYEVYAKMLSQRYFGKGIHQYRCGLFASEGHFSLPLDVDSNESVLIPDSMFYEFLPLGETDTTKCITMDQVEVGQEYEIITTNVAGLYRYRMQESLKVVGWFNETPIVEYQRRLNQQINLTGEKTSEVALNMATARTAQLLDFEMIEYSAYADLDSEPFGYNIFMEIGHQPKELTAEAIRVVLEQQLAEANPSLGDKLTRGIVAPVKLSLLSAGTYLRYRKKRVKEGAAAMQMKPPHVLINAEQYQFFKRFVIEEVKG